MKRLLFCLVTLSFVAGCGSSHKSAQTCSVGVDANSCSAAVVSATPSKWTQTVTIGDSSHPSQESQVDVSYEFKKSNQETLWRRTMTVASKTSSRTMYEQGVVQSIGSDHFVLHVTSSSCDLENPPTQTDTFLYYLRNGSSLSLDTSPIQRPNNSSVTGAVANAVGGAIVNVLSMGMSEALTLGSLRTFLDSGHGTFSLDKNPTKISGQVGCYSSLGSFFYKSKKSSDW